MKKLISILLAISLLLSGCALFGPKKQVTKNQDKLDKQVQKTTTTKTDISKNQDDKMNQVSAYAYGINYSLNQVTNASAPVATAIKLNGRIMSIVGSPEIDEMNKISQIVDLLNSEVSKEKSKGEKLLKSKDTEIQDLQDANKQLKDQYERQIIELIAKSKSIAKSGDNTEAIVEHLSGNLGLNAVLWGLKKFILSSLTILLVCSIVFLLLRAFAASNPIVGTIFSIFELIGGGLINLIKGLVPNSIDFSNLVHLDTHTKYKDTLDKIVDTIETFKIKCEAGTKQCTLADVLDELDRVMDQKDKDAIKDVLKDQKWGN